MTKKNLERKRKKEDIKLKESKIKTKYFCLFVWVLWHINLCRLFNAKSIFIQINSSISNNSVWQKVHSLNAKNIYFKLFSLVKQF